MLSSLLTTLTTMLHHLVPQPLRPRQRKAVPLTDLPLDVVLHVLDRLDAPALAALGRTSKALHALCAPRLFAAVDLSSPRQLDSLLAALRANPARGPLVRALSERGLAAHPAQLQAALEQLPRLRALRLHSALAGLDLAPLAHLAELHLHDATRGTLAILPTLAPEAPLATLGVHCWPAALPAAHCAPPELAGALAAFLDARPTITALEADAAVLADVPVPPTVSSVTAHGADGHRCAWCAPPGAMWEDRETAPAARAKGARQGYWARANVALCRWLLAVTGLSGGF